MIQSGELGFRTNFYKMFDGRLIEAIHSMCKIVKSCVKISSHTTEYFNIYQGDRQDENMSTVLSCIFLKDFGHFMQPNGCMQIDSDIQHGEILAYLEILILLHADDADIFATDLVTFQHYLNVFLHILKFENLA